VYILRERGRENFYLRALSVANIIQNYIGYGALVYWTWQRQTALFREKPEPVLIYIPQIPHGLTLDRTRASAAKLRLPIARGVRKTSDYVILLSRLLKTVKWSQFMPYTAEVPHLNIGIVDYIDRLCVDFSVTTGRCRPSTSTLHTWRPFSYKQIPVHHRQFILILNTMCNNGAVP
jgi:hypothetical protein